MYILNIIAIFLAMLIASNAATYSHHANLFKILKACTIHFTNSNDYLPAYRHKIWSSYHSTFLDDCCVYKNCVSIHTKAELLEVFNSSNGEESSRVEMQLFSGSLIKAVGIEFINFTKTLNKTLLPQKHSRVCTLQLPNILFDNVSRMHQFSYLDNRFWMRQDLMRQAISASNKFAVVPLPFSNDPGYTLEYMLVPLYINTRCWFMDDYTEIVYIGSRDMQTEWVYQYDDRVVYARNGVELLQSLISRLDISLKTDGYFALDHEYWKTFRRKVINQANLQLKVLGNSQHWLPEGSSSKWMKSGFYPMIGAYLNNTKHFDKCYEKTYAYETAMESLYTARRRTSKYFPYGQNVNDGGFKYLIMTGNGHSLHSSGGLDSLLLPLEWRIWFWFAATFLCIMCIIKGTNGGISLKDSAFWLIISLLEQGNDGSRFRSRICSTHLLLWLLLGNFMRNFYTTTLYSDMTAQPDPSWLPDSLSAVMSEYQNANETHHLIRFATIHSTYLVLFNEFSNAYAADNTALVERLERYMEHVYALQDSNNFWENVLRHLPLMKKLPVSINFQESGKFFPEN